MANSPVFRPVIRPSEFGTYMSIQDAKPIARCFHFQLESFLQSLRTGKSWSEFFLMRHERIWSLKYHRYRELRCFADSVRDELLTGKVLCHRDEDLNRLSIKTLQSTWQSHLQDFFSTYFVFGARILCQWQTRSPIAAVPTESCPTELLGFVYRGFWKSYSVFFLVSTISSWRGSKATPLAWRFLTSPYREGKYSFHYLAPFRVTSCVFCTQRKSMRR